MDDCDTDTYGLEQAVDFIKGKIFFMTFCRGKICFGVKSVLDKTLGEIMFQKDPLYKVFFCNPHSNTRNHTNSSISVFADIFE